MPSPFPGMNPYLEHAQVWADFPNTFITRLRAMLLPLVLPKYYVQMEENLYRLDTTDGDLQLVRISDVDTAEYDAGARPIQQPTNALLPRMSKVVIPELLEQRFCFLEVVERDSEKVVTVIELLSPSNKTQDPDREKYLEKQRSLIESGVNYVELDLRRAGVKLPLRGRPKSDYYALISRPADRPNADCCSFGIRDALPSIPIPLQPDDHEVAIERFIPFD